MHRITTITVALVLVGAGACTAEVREIIAPRGTGIELDGILDDEAWQAAPVTEPFLYLSSHTEAHIQTRVRMAYDDETLYIAVEAEEPNMAAVRSRPRERDGDDIWRDDSMEVFLALELGGMRYYHLIWNLDGAKYDARHGDAGLATAWDPEPDWSVTVARGEDGWTSEVAVPLAALGAETPLKGELWGLKLARSLWGRGGNRDEDSFTSWTFCPGGYHDPAGWGRLYFGGTNMLANGDFASEPTDTGLPPTWARSLKWEDDQEDTGSVEQVTVDGENLLHVRKFEDARGSLLPRAYCHTTVRGGHAYRLSAQIRGEGTATLIFSWRTEKGDGYIPTPVELSDRFQTFSAECDLPEDVATLATMFAFTRESTGDMWIRRVELADLGVPVEAPEADAIHNLRAAASTLVEMKPYELLADEEGRYQFERLIFTDTGTGTEIRRIDWDRSAGDIIYSNRYPWNPDGSAFKFSAWERPGPLYFIAEPSGASFRTLGIELPSQGPRWGSDPDWLYYGTREALMRVNWRTREEEEVFRIPEEIMEGGRPRFQWNMELPGLVYYEQAFGPDAPLYFIDLESGEYTRIPITTDSTGDPADDWLYSAGLTRLRGQWWVGYSLNHLPHLSEQNPYQQRLSSLDGTVGLNRLSLSQPEGADPQPLYSHGGRSPDGKLECGYHGGGIALWDYEKWEGKMLVPGAGGGHISWMYLDDWFFAGTHGRPLSGPFASQLLKVYVDGTWYRVAYGNTDNTEYKTNLFANISPDGTKGAYMSSMLGPVCVYWCVISYPEPPRNVVAETDGATVALTWDRPERSAELLGYNVYRSDRSGVGYERVSDEPVARERFVDTVPDAGRPWYYAVTAVERSGLESRSHTGEAVGGAPAPDAPERLFVEAEAGELLAPIRENLHGSASNLLFVDYRDGEGEGRATWRFPTRNAGAHTLWVRMRYRGSGTPDAGWQVSAQGEDIGRLITGSREWEWVRLDQSIQAPAGGAEVAVTASEAAFAIDKLLLTDDPDFEPAGKHKIDADAPPSPTGLSLAGARSFDLAIEWGPVTDCDHYQVYRGDSADFEPTQEHLVGSPSVARFIEWGLQQGTRYWYRVSAVDAFGNESEATPALEVATEPLEDGPVEIELEAEAGEMTGLAELMDEPAASGGRFVKMAPQGEGEDQVFPTLDMDFEVPVEGEYVVWLRMCPVSDRGYAYVHASVDGGHRNHMLCRFPTRMPTSSFEDVNIWRYVYDMRSEVPVRFHLEPGEHTLTLSEAHMQEFGIDCVVVSNDLGRRPEGRHLQWE